MCPVLEECQRDTLGEIDGVWGGLDPLERRKAREKLTKAIDGWEEPLRLEWAREIHALRGSGLKWVDIQQRTGIPAGAGEKLFALWDMVLKDAEDSPPRVVDLPLPEPEESPAGRHPAFPDRLGRRDAWVRNNGLMSDAWYRAETPDREWIYLTVFSGRGQVLKWFPANEVWVYRPVAVVIREFTARPDEPKEAPDAAA